MIDLQAYLEKKLRDVISTWTEADIYAISFFVYSKKSSNSSFKCNGILRKL